MVSSSAQSLSLLILSIVLTVGRGGDWNILHVNQKGVPHISIKNYCESWKINVELHNIRKYRVVPQECVEYIGKYMTSTQYKTDVQRAAEQVVLYITENFVLDEDGKDAWIFDIDDTLLSTVPYYKNHQFGGEKLNITLLEKWMKNGKAPPLKPTLCLYNHIKRAGLKIFLVSGRNEHLRDATVDNLLKVGYAGWTSLILRGDEDAGKTAESFKAEQRNKIVAEGYRIWGVVADQWSSLLGYSTGLRTFKLPNPMYYAP
ncbi:Acid phosphatase 1 [Nymphaea thermarum]|nr:Acid phosphatase 1 [Nymphaea thermarum]